MAQGKQVLVRLSVTAGVALLVAVLSYNMMFPCGCLGYTRDAPTTGLTVEAPAFCAEVRTSSPWRDAQGGSLNPDWQSDISIADSRYIMRTRTRYIVRVEEGGSHLVGIARQDRAAANEFRIVGRRAVPVDSRTWMSGRLLPFSQELPPRQVAAGFAAKYPLLNPHLAPPGGAWFVTHSHDGHAMGGPMLPGPDFLVSNQRTAYLLFQLSGPDTVTAPVVRYRFCPDWSWISAGASWHGTNLFTAPLSEDGRTFLFCDLSKAAQK